MVSNFERKPDREYFRSCDQEYHVNPNDFVQVDRLKLKPKESKRW